MNKVNGYTQKPHPFQITAYVFFSCLLLTYFLITFPLSSPAGRAVGATLIVVLMTCVGISCHLCTSTDTTDPMVKETWRLKNLGKSYSHLKTETKCDYDRAYIDESSKHCKRCKRCTIGFDHHCKWINNDIGKYNYKSFVAMIFSAFLFLSTYLVFGALATARYAFESDMVDYDIWMFRHNSSDIVAGMIVLWIFMLLAIMFTLLDLNLVLFHIFLIRKGLTTFQYITYVQERKEYRKEMEYAMSVLGEKKTRLDFILCLNRKKKIANISMPTTPKEDGLIAKKETPIGELKIQKMGTGLGLLNHQDDVDQSPDIMSEKHSAAEIYQKDKLVSEKVTSQNNVSSAQLKGNTLKDSIEENSQSKMLLKDSERRKENLSIEIPHHPNDKNNNKRNSLPHSGELSPEKSGLINAVSVKNEHDEDKLISKRARKNTDESNSSKNHQRGQPSTHNNHGKKINFEKGENDLIVKDADSPDDKDGIELKSPNLNSAEIANHDKGDIEHGFGSNFNDFRENEDEVHESKYKVIEGEKKLIANTKDRLEEDQEIKDGKELDRTDKL